MWAAGMSEERNKLRTGVSSIVPVTGVTGDDGDEEMGISGVLDEATLESGIGNRGSSC